MPPSLASRLLFHASPQKHLVGSPELSAEIYDFIALVLRAYVSPWWSKITRYDKDLLPQISAILAHVILQLDARVAAQDLPSLVFHDAPAILTQHYRDYRNAAAKIHTAYATGGAASLPTLFASLQPHMAISSDGIIDREYYRQIVDHILRQCLPPEDYDPEPERIIIREVIVKLLVDDILPKVTQPWFIQKTILDLIGSPAEPLYIPPPPPQPAPTAAAGAPTATAASTFSFNSLIIIILSALQSFSSTCLALIHGYKQAIKLLQTPNEPHPTSSPPPTTQPVLSSPPLSPTASLSSTPSISSHSHSQARCPPADAPITTAPPSSAYAHAPLILLSELISAPSRLAATSLMHTLQTLALILSPVLDKLLPPALSAFLSPAFLLSSVRAGRRALFPNGYPGPTPPDPTPEEQAALRARLVAWRPSGGLGLLTPILLGPDPSATLGMALDPLSDPQCNLRLAVFLIDCVLLSLFPELAPS